MMTKETEKEFNKAFMNNGVNGVLDNKFQDPKMLYIKAFISTHFIDNRVIEEKIEEHHKKELAELATSDNEEYTKKHIAIGFEIYKKDLKQSLTNQQ